MYFQSWLVQPVASASCFCSDLLKWLPGTSLYSAMSRHPQCQVEESLSFVNRSMCRQWVHDNAPEVAEWVNSLPERPIRAAEGEEPVLIP